MAVVTGLVTLGLTLPPSAQAVPGPIVEYKVPTAAAGLNGITSGPDGALWFTETDANKIGRISADGKVTEFKIPIASSKPLQITAGGDGALWFTMSAVNMIGHITTAGVFKTFTVPTANSTPTGITYNQRDGLVWFTEAAVGKIASITKAGVIVERGDFMVAAEGPVAITPGPLGSVWYVTSTNQLNYHQVPDLGYGESTPLGMNTPTSLAMGDDGAMWVASAGQVQRIDHFGATPTNIGLFGTIGGITAGADRALWATLSTPGGYVARITTAGVLTEYLRPNLGPTQNSFLPLGITSGPDGAIWFTDPGNNMIGRIVTNDISTTPPQPAVLVAYSAVVAKTKVTVNYALTGNASLSLVVKNSKGVSTTVASAKAKTGKGALTWNRKLKNKPAPKGKYTVTVVATTGVNTAKSSLPVTLK
jgi:virginiamycin B lyase